MTYLVQKLFKIYNANKFESEEHNGLTCNLNAVLIIWIHLAQFIQLFLSNYSDISPVTDILSLL